MSIIYRALQKTQKNREKNLSAPLQERQTLRPNWALTSLIAVSAVLVTVLALNYLPVLKSHLATTAKPVKVLAAPTMQMVINEDKFKSQYVLNGIFLSDNTKIAMINSQYFHVGDAIDGLRIVHICDKDVKLTNQNQTITLEIPV
ncbi:MAG: hypothetical protein P4M14_00650 [Gammaproteobacteria bacterium]|nr:hypothetical protein [Gammaproteobacteria bacterium]